MGKHRVRDVSAPANVTSAIASAVTTVGSGGEEQGGVGALLPAPEPLARGPPARSPPGRPTSPGCVSVAVVRGCGG